MVNSPPNSKALSLTLNQVYASKAPNISGFVKFMKSMAAVCLINTTVNQYSVNAEMKGTEFNGFLEGIGFRE
jgi:hypothetical protein